jgi:uncharacterized membrane protein
VRNYLISIGLIAAYPLLVHISVVFNLPHLLALGPLVCILGLFWRGLLNFNRYSWLIFVVLIGVLVLMDRMKLTLYLLYLPPIFIPLLLLFVFGRTLIAGREPLITAIGEAARGPLSQPMRHYTRRLTQLWCVVFIVMASWACALPWLKDPGLWSWFTNVINYGFVGGLFLGEFILRKYLFPTHNHPNFFEYLCIIARHDIRH